MSSAVKIIRLLQPLQILMTLLTYVLGLGMARYLGYPAHYASIWLGLVTVLPLQMAAFLLTEYFRLPSILLEPGETPRQREQFRVLLLQVSAAALTLATAAVVLMLYFRLLPSPAGVLLAAAFVFLVSYAVPPLRLVDSGFGELVLAIYMATILPAFAYLLQTSEYHRLLAMITFPLTLLALAYLLVLDFPTFASDQKLARRTLLTQLTWQHAIPIHQFLFLAAFLLFASAPLLGFPWELVWPVFLVLPFAGFQMFWLQRIGQGGRTLWRFLTSLASAVFGLTVYLLALTFWIR